ncbi:unnamed protein product [Diatraea saccharalis]|uniref:Uncharacterized protein n=1 Tax=Diatraea saccharalis TaxID=40085 RepID=A0A9N9R2W8_9NEOP|nr:unnamed protein product [Diatraea saccharalis]
MAEAAAAPARQPRRGPAPIASFDHDVSDESSPETKPTVRLPEIREDSSATAATSGDALAPPEQRARSHSTPGALQAPPAPRIDISRASSSSHQDSRDSSPELALFAGSTPGAGELGFREDGALDLRSSTEELAFLEPAPGERAAPAPPERRPSRKDSQGSEAALLAVSGRTSRLSSVGSQCSAHSALSAFSRTGRVSRLSVASGASRSPSPHRMLLETSFCGPKPIETDPEICAAAVEERLLEIAKLGTEGQPPPALAPAPAPAPAPTPAFVPVPLDARDRREVRTEATVERATPRPTHCKSLAADGCSAPGESTSAPAGPRSACEPAPPPVDREKNQKEKRNRARAEERQARSRERRDPIERRAKSQTKDIIRIRLKPSDEYDDDDVDDEDDDRASSAGPAPAPAAFDFGGAGGRPVRPTDLASEAPASRRPPRDCRTPSPPGAGVSRKSSFCSLFKSRETIASPESPSDALRRKKSSADGRSRSRSRDRSATPTSATKIRGSVLSLFRTPRKSATSPSPSSRDGSPVVQQARQLAPQQDRPRRGERLKYYEDGGIIHIPLRTPPEEAGATRPSDVERRPSAPEPRTRELEVRPASAPQPRAPALPSMSTPSPAPPATKPIRRTVLPDGSIIIPLRSPTEKTAPEDVLAPGDPPAESPEANRSIESAPRTSSAAATTSIERTTSSETSPVPSERPPGASVAADPPPDVAPERARRRERLVFTTNVGSEEQKFSTQFSITKTPSVTSEISGSFPSFPDTEETRDARGSTPASTGDGGDRPEREAGEAGEAGEVRAGSSRASPQEARDSSGSEASSEAGVARAGSDVEARGLVVQESFEEELPYVPTTLPQERSLALPMVPVRERGAATLHVAPVERPRPPHASRPSLPSVPQYDVSVTCHDLIVDRGGQASRGARTVVTSSSGPAVNADADKLRIKLPRRPRTGSAGAPVRPERTRTRSGSEGFETRSKTEWIDFSEVPERRKQPTRIQTLPASRDVVFNYVAPEECRCECHARDTDAEHNGPGYYHLYFNAGEVH